MKRSPTVTVTRTPPVGRTPTLTRTPPGRRTPTGRRTPSGRRTASTQKIAYLFIAPFFVVFLVFQLAAMVASLGLSLTNWKGATGGEYVGFSNYTSLFVDPVFLAALGHTVIVWILTVPALSFGALFLAHLLNQKITRGKSVLRTLYFLPVLPPLVVVGVLFLLLLDPVYGLPNIFLQSIGLPPINIRSDPAVALPVLSLVIFWRWLGYNMTIHLAALQSLPSEVMESARVDGVNAWQMFWNIIVPMSKPTLIFTAVMSTIGTFNLFDEPYVLFGPEAGPNQAGLTLGTYMFRQGFEFFNLGYASAISYTVAIIVLVVSLLQMRMSRDV